MAANGWRSEDGGGGGRESRGELDRKSAPWRRPERSGALPPFPFYYPFPRLRKERIADAVRAAVKIFFENKDTVSG